LLRPETSALLVVASLAALALAGCGNGKVIGSGPLPTSPPVTPHVSFEYKIPTAGSSPAAIVTGRDGFLYFTEQASSKIGQLTTGGAFSEIATATPAAGPLGIIVGADNHIWFAESAAHKVATITSFTESPPTTEFTVPWANAAPSFLANGATQGTMYFTDPANSAIGEITTTGTFTGPFATITAGANPLGITLGQDNNIWFCENAAAKIGHLNTATNTVDHEYALSAGANPVNIVPGLDGALWFTENDPAGPRIGRLTTTGVLNEYPLTGAKSATGLALNIFGNFVVVDAANNSIGIFEPNTSKYTEYPIKTGSSNPTWVTLGPDARMYFTENGANQIGQFSYF
jgi:virginiamycin B lyase